MSFTLIFAIFLVSILSWFG